MSQLSLAALPLLRSCRHTGRLINVVISRGLALSARLQKNQGVPSFTKASSPELDEILQEFRSKIILPLYLNKKQRQLIFKRKYASQLENDPVTATIGDEEFRLEPLDVLKDIPGTAQELGKILALTKDHNDWLNWLPILEGLGRRKKTPDKWRNRFIRSAILAGESEVVISALRRVKRTRLHLSSPSLRGIVFRGLRNLAQQHGWSQDALEQALRRVKEVINLMEDEAHCGNRRVDTRDPRAEPLTLGTLAELAARRSAIEGDDQEGYKAFAVDYGERLVLALEQQDTDLKTLKSGENFEETVESKLIEQEKKKEGYYWLYYQKMAEWIPVWHALRLMQDPGLSFSDSTSAAIQGHTAAVAELLDRLHANLKAHVPASWAERGAKVHGDGGPSAEWELIRTGSSGREMRLGSSQ